MKIPKYKIGDKIYGYEYSAYGDRCNFYAKILSIQLLCFSSGKIKDIYYEVSSLLNGFIDIIEEDKIIDFYNEITGILSPV